METTINPNAGSVQIFKNPAFGQMRVQSNERGQAWFCLSDVCRVEKTVKVTPKKRRKMTPKS